MSSALVNMSSALVNMSNAYVTAFRTVVIKFIPFYSAIQYNKGFTLLYILEQIKFVINTIYEDGAEKSELIQLIIVELRKHFKNKIVGGKHYRKKSLKKNDGNIFKIHLNEWENSVIKKMQENPKQSGGTGGTNTHAPPPHGFIPKLLKLLFIIVVFAQLFSTPNAVPSTVNAVPPVQVDRDSTEVVKAFLELKNSEMPQRVIDLFPNIQGVCVMLTSAMANALLPYVDNIWTNSSTYIYPEPRNFDRFSNEYARRWEDQVLDIQHDYKWGRGSGNIYGPRSKVNGVTNFGVDGDFIENTFVYPYIMDPYVSNPTEFLNLSTKETHKLSEKNVRDYFEKYLIESKYKLHDSESSLAELNPYQSYDTVNNLQIAIFLIKSIRHTPVGKTMYHAVLGGYNVNTKKLFLMDPNRLVKMNPDTYIFEWDPIMIAEDGAFSKSDLMLAGSLIQTIKGSILKAYGEYHINDGEYHINDGNHNSLEPPNIESSIEQVFPVLNNKSPLVSYNRYKHIGPPMGPYANPFATFSKELIKVVSRVYEQAYEQVEDFNKKYEETHGSDKSSFLHPPNSEDNDYKATKKENAKEGYEAAKSAIAMVLKAPGRIPAENELNSKAELDRLANLDAARNKKIADESAKWLEEKLNQNKKDEEQRKIWAKQDEERNAAIEAQAKENAKYWKKLNEEQARRDKEEKEQNEARVAYKTRLAEEQAAEEQAAEKQAAEERVAAEEQAKKNTLLGRMKSLFHRGGKTHKNKKLTTIKTNKNKIHQKRSTCKNKYYK